MLVWVRMMDQTLSQNPYHWPILLRLWLDDSGVGVTTNTNQPH